MSEPRHWILASARETGEVVYYTGRAGPGWVGSREEAFAYLSVGHARERARAMSRMAPLHGFEWIAVPIYQEEEVH